MNILFYCDEYPPYRTGGIGTVTKIVAESLASKGHNIFVLGYYPKNKDLPQYAEINGVHVYRYNRSVFFQFIKKKIYPFFYKLKCTTFIIQKELSFIEKIIKKTIREKNIHILELTDFYSFNMQSSGILNFQDFGIPTVLRVHGSASFLANLRGSSSAIISKNDSLHFKRCNHICAVSNYSLCYVRNNFDFSHFLTQKVIYNPIEDLFLNRTPPSKSDDILFIGKLTETKGCYSLLKAFNVCAEKFPKLQLRLVGGGDIEKAKSYVKSEFLHRVHFLGFCNREQIKMEIDNCLFACMPTYFETFGMVALETMSRQRAVIYTERTSGREIIIDGKDGFTVDPTNIDAIVERIVKLYTDKKCRDEIANQAYLKIYNNFTASKIVNQLESYYKSLVNS